MKINIKILGLIFIIFVLSCEENDPLSFYGGQDLVALVDEAWDDFNNADSSEDYENALDKFNQAKDSADVQVDMDTLLIHTTYSDIHTGIGWCNLRLLNADIARDNFITSQGYEEYSFGTSVGLMTAYYELAYRQDEGEDNDPDISLSYIIDTTQINLAIDIGHWIFSSGMPDEFVHDTTINVDDVRLLMAKSYFAKGDLSDNETEEAGALHWILRFLDGNNNSTYDYLDENVPESWYVKGSESAGAQAYDSFEEVILMIIIRLEWEVFD